MLAINMMNSVGRMENDFGEFCTSGLWQESGGLAIRLIDMFACFRNVTNDSALGARSTTNMLGWFQTT